MIQGSKIRHYIGGKDFGEPRNWQELEIIVDWLNNKEGVNINTADLEFVLEANKHIQQRILDGLSGGVGIFEGEPYSISVGDPLSPSYVFNGYLDFTDETNILGQEEIICSLKKKTGEDWLNDVADSFSFAYLKDQGVINTGDYIKVPYVINYIPDGTQLILLSMSLFMMTKELIQNVQDLGKNIANFADVAVPTVGTSVGIGAGVVTAWDLGKVIIAGAKLALQIAYTIAITIAIINLMEEVFKQILPKKRYHLGMSIKTMFQRGCDYLGLKLQSTLLDELSDIVHIPQKDKKGGTNGETGHPVNSGAIYTFGDCIRVFSEAYNADYRITNNTFIFERRDNFETLSPYVIPAFLNEQERLLNVNSFNTDEMVANYNINYAFDSQDQNTLDDQTGRVFQAITTPKVTKDKQLVNIKGLNQISIPFSIGKTKNDFTGVEKVAKDVAKFVDRITGLFGNGTSLQRTITSRIGSMLMSSDFLTSGRLVKMSGGKLTKDQRADLSAESLWFKYHFINSFAEVNGVHNQYWRYKGLRIPMSLSDFEKVLENNIVTNENGERVEIENISYKPQEGYAILDYRVKKKYTNNLKIDYVR